MSGAGKSVIAAIVFDYLNNTFSQSNPNMSVAVLYCDHQLQADQTLDELERSIFHQASVDYLTFPEELRQLHRDTRRGFPPSLEKLRSAVRLTSAMSRTPFVVLDALDEANEKVQDLIVDRISNLPFQDVRLFCTSRSLPKFKHMFATTDEIEIAAFDDISIFVRKQVSLQSRLRTIIGTDSGLEKSIVDKVTKEVNGSFLMASRYMSSLSQAGSKGYLLLTTDYLYLPVNDAYDLTMKRVREQLEADRKRAEQTLSLIFGSTRFNNSTPRLAMKEVQHALATLSYSDYGYDVKSDDLPDIDLIVQCCQGLLVLDGDSVLRPSHDTIDQYLRRGQVLETYLPNALEVLSAACCYYLSQDSLHLAILATISTAPRGRQERKGDYWKRIDDYHDYQERSEKVFDEFPFLKHASAHFHIYLWKAYGKRCPAILAEKYGGMTDSWNQVVFPDFCATNDLVKRQPVFRLLHQFEQQAGSADSFDNIAWRELCRAVETADKISIDVLLRFDDLRVVSNVQDLTRILTLAIDSGFDGVVRHLLEGDWEVIPQLPRESMRKLRMKALRRARSVFGTSWPDEDPHIRALQWLIATEHGSSPRSGRNLCDRVLDCASNKASYKILGVLIQADMDIHAADADGNPVLCRLLLKAAEYGCDPLLDCLGQEVAHGSVFRRFGECQGEFCEEDTDLIEQLLGRKYATDVNQTYELGRNAVSYATMSSHPCQSVVCKLIEHHADVTKRDVDGMTPILYTAANAEYHSMLWDMIWAYENANGMDESNSYTTLCYSAELTLSSDPDVPEPTQKVISARIDFCSIVLRRITKYCSIKDLDRILLTLWRFLEKADLDLQSANRRTLRAAMEDAGLADIHIMSKVLYYCRQSVDEIDLRPPEQWRAVNQQQVEAQMGIDEVRGKTIKRVLSECLTSKMKELCGKRERQIGEAARPSIP
ncbi:hypothetical protein CGCA056_v003707 [Colletotrichum aenigma]|uniref:uncharacterized protein n=1 Tax=Colletotrichum aenigma TaxID=1215731 RepID=UPI0018722267|nr:uncharacterized protein CGCA056_v003707 [Colletotrichum aenigma]KAF5525816.1 hypothetical protein CGCA056_v003707 [Colletotrichum aenigma]